MADVDLNQDKWPHPTRHELAAFFRDVSPSWAVDAAARAPQKRSHKRCNRGGRMTAYDDQNIFAKILRGEIPSIKLFEDDDTYCFMDIMPRADGHCLVIPKTPCRNVLDASHDQLASVMKTVQLMSHAVMKAFGAEGVTLQQFNEDAGGQEVYHLHFHILPRHADVSLRPPGKMAEMDVLNAQAAQIRAALE